MHAVHSSRFRLLVGALLISFSPVMVKVAGQTVGPTAIAFWRTLIGGCVLVLLALLSGKSLRLPAAALRWSLIAGFAFFLDLFCWHRSILYVGTGMATILGNTQVFATALLSIWVFSERLSLRFVLSAVAAFGGVVLLVGIGSEEIQFTDDHVLGIVLGLATGLAYSAYIIGLKKGTTQDPKPDLIVFMAWTSFVSALLLGASAAAEGDPFLPLGWADTGSIVGYGVLVQALAWLIITSALPGVPTAQAGLILLLQPTLATVWGVLFFDERLVALQILGACITLAGMYTGGLGRKGAQPKRDPRPTG